jgi:1-acyl-sn-glycerol-3-phosphate acyltransferase
MHGINWILRRIFGLLCRIDKKAFDHFPKKGPIILVGNHINFMEVPLLVSHLDNPLLTGLAKRETWDNPLFKFLFNAWKIIPIDRGMVDREAIRLSLEALEQGKMLAIAPEGTRSKDGKLQPGKPGVVALAIQSGAPLQPFGFYGHENFWQNLKRLRRTDFCITVGKPFRINTGVDYRSREARQEITDEIMYKIAECLPERYRGHYQFEGKIEYKHLIDL